MAVIKTTNTLQLMKNARVLDLHDLTNEGSRIVSTARAEAEQIIEDAVRTAEASVAAAHKAAQEKGFAAGLAEGREAGTAAAREETAATMREQMSDLQERWTAALESWQEERDAMMLAAREDVLALAVELARRVTYRVVQLDPTVIHDQLIEALRLVTRSTAVEVHINPEDRGILQDLIGAVLDGVQCCDDIVLRDDASIERGGCVVRTAGGAIDASLHTKLDRIAEALLPDHHVPIAAAEPEPGDEPLPEGRDGE